uniref:PRA1 family protein n=1 Tax=Rhizophora mucronata TaxID=61149 RepID=A0A2P2Q4Y5_RHIMU
MSSPATLPTSTSQPPSSVTSQSQATLISSLRSSATHLSGSVRQALANRRPWKELIDRSAFSRPDSLSHATTRIRKNFNYFRVNYLTLLAIVLALSLLSHPFSLLTLLSLLAAWLCLYAFRPAGQPLVILGRTFSDRETLGILILSTVIVVFLTSVGSLLISATLVGLGIVCAHGAFRDPEDLFMDEQEALGSGLFSFIGGAASSAAAATGPAAMSRV